ncbi:sulfotransferase family protein [Primorskyibacter sp. S187A]|uniref:sulfotransferase family protein n=1 Tax=Primorskyibacter sp. S187A TaxID=3415130 RepID=UPI003C7BB491
MTDKTFFLGLGGQKCGSSWMQAYLARQDGSDFGRLGEYQIWESDLGSVFARYKVAKPSAFELVRARAKEKLGAAVPKDYLRWQMQTDRSLYFDYFQKLLKQSSIDRTGDITPSYAALPAPMLAGIRDGFAARDIKVRAMFSMRDPVARLRSHLKMEMAKGRIDETDEISALDAFFAGPEAAARMRYDLTLAAMEEVFAPQDRFITLFETLFTPEGVSEFAQWADVPLEPEAGSVSVNARGSGKETLPDSLMAKIALHYRPVYEAAARRKPEIARLWPSAAYVL